MRPEAKLKAEFAGAWIDNDTCLRTIGRVQREHGYLLDPAHGGGLGR